jgi:hypothetical protein
MTNPMELAHATIAIPMSLAQAQEALGKLLAGGVDLGGRHRAVCGWRRGEFFSFSFGLPVTGAHEPVLRGRLAEVAGGVEARVAVGPRMFALAGWWVLILFALAGVAYVVLFRANSPQAPADARLAAVQEALPNIAILLGIVAVSVAFWRWQGARSARDLMTVLRLTLHAESDSTGASAAGAAPIH